MNKALLLFQTRCNYGHYKSGARGLRAIAGGVAKRSDGSLADFASTGEETVKDMLEPIEQWRKSYPDDPSPNPLLVNFYRSCFAVHVS